jgi:hypothetical protein
MGSLDTFRPPTKKQWGKALFALTIGLPYYLPKWYLEDRKDRKRREAEDKALYESLAKCDAKNPDQNAHYSEYYCHLNRAHGGEHKFTL